MRVVIDLSEQDLEHFRAAMRRAKEAAAHLSAAEITGAAMQLLEDTKGVQVPEFVSSRMKRLGTLVGMVHDTNWGISDEERKEILSALTYFSDPNDAIPDDIPVLGFLDDAIMIELVVEELKHEIDAYEDFCLFRKQAEDDIGAVEASGLNRDDWLQQRQNELLDRMRGRRSRDSASYGGGRGGFSLFSIR
ncbi:MAG: YkvA family protein [Lysobacterales bacterium]|nr:DUF1232 domain-containing protein [Xanthomonadales bacterium]MCB1611419.1 DUF1232 domain-containing protein [Xanthomonadales bacterium]MCP5476911.1 DUF1232 domain-containing protein [Rhodanobacteraceae bacterium]